MKNENRKPKTFQNDLKRWKEDAAFRKHYQREGVKLRIAYRITELRHKAGLTQAQLAKKIGTTQSGVARLEAAESENYEVETLERIAEACGKTLCVNFQ